MKIKAILNSLLEDCWKGYTQYGMKTKNGKQVPNCVPINENEQPLVDILFDDAKSRVLSFSTTHDILNPEVLSVGVAKEVQKQLTKKNIDPQQLEYQGYVAYGWQTMWELLQKIKSNEIPHINALYVDSDIEYEEPDTQGLTHKKPKYSYGDKQRLAFYNVKHGLTPPDTLSRISKAYRQITQQDNIDKESMNYYLPYGIGLIDYLKDNPQVGHKIDNIIIANSSNSTAQYFVDQLKPLYGTKVKRILPSTLHSRGYIL